MMKEILITSSVLILALLAIRQVFKGVLSRRVQYALWALVLVRLLIPVSFLPAADFSVLTATAPVQTAVTTRLEQIVPGVPARLSPVRPDGQQPVQTLSPDISRDSVQYEGPLLQIMEPGELPKPNNLTLGEVLALVWKVGMVLMGAFFLVSNLRFDRKLRKNRREWQAEGGLPHSSRKVYVVPEGVLPSPCLFGRSIYLTPAVAADPDKLRHVLAHESTHAKHLDPLWSLLRCLCLTVYWFDPLVWVAAWCSKADCELACDESVLDALGEQERIPYGRTLLSLIPVKRVANPMIAATTMTAGKKQLRDRVTRIAKQPRQLLAAALAVAVLAGIVSACTFTGAKPSESVAPAPSPSQSPAENALRSLTGEELRWFNEEFFNYHPIPVISNTYTIRNQFINAAFNLYDRPENIDLYQLFYCDGSILSDAEYRAVYGGEEMNCPAFKLTSEEMDDILREYTGLTLAQTNKVGLENFTYQDGAYYWMHGDTNYPGSIEIPCGTREGSTVKLYHHGWNSGSEWYCATLEAQPDGGYWFVSNQESEKPAIPTSLPAWEPEAVIDLSDLEPYTAPAVELAEGADHYDYNYETCYANWDFDGRNVMLYRSDDGAVKAGIRQEDGTMNVFARYNFDDVNMFFFNDLFGHDGFTITYQPGANSRFYSTDTDYYYFDENGVLVLLAQCHGESQIIDLNGDGQNELIAPRQIFFQRDGTVYEAWLDELLQTACPELTYWDYEVWNKYGKYLAVTGLSMPDQELNGRNYTRYLYFDGENILAYMDEKPTTDHLVDGADEGVPAAVVEAARDYAQKVYTASQNPTAPEPEGEQYAWGHPATWDDWRLESFHGPYSYTYGGVTVVGWGFNYELHTTTPDQVVQAGGTYLTEDNWVSPGYPGCDYLFFRQETDGGLTFLWKAFYQESMNSHYVEESVFHHMEEHGLALSGGASYAGLQIASDLSLVLDHSSGGFRIQLNTPDGVGGGAYLLDPDQGNGPYYRALLSDPGQFHWTRVDAPAEVPAGTSLILAQGDWYHQVQFWEGSDLVMSKGQNQEPVWYQAELVGLDPGDPFYESSRIFPFLRGWFDEAEINKRRDIVLLDRGQPPYETARDYLELYEVQSKLDATPGSQYACTYAKIADLEYEYPDPDDKSHFRFSYSLIFVPESEKALNAMMAGNTGEYEGSDPAVPEGAFQYWRMGGMTLENGRWICTGTYTG